MFTKLFSSITTSSIWNEDNNTRIVWITMLALVNKHGYVSASVGGLAHEARVTREDCEKALKVLTSPDEDSRSKEFDGRRIEIVDGGFQLLNYDKYRAMRSEEERKEYMKTYMVEYRARTKNVNNNVNIVSEYKPPLAKAEAEAEAEADKNNIYIKKSFKPPTPEQVINYGEKISLSGTEAAAFFDHHGARGWIMSNGKKMVDWQAALRTWKRNGERFASNGSKVKPKGETSVWEKKQQEEAIVLELNRLRADTDNFIMSEDESGFPRKIPKPEIDVKLKKLKASLEAIRGRRTQI